MTRQISLPRFTPLLAASAQPQMLPPVPIAHQVASLYHQLQIRPGLLESGPLTESGANCAVCDIVTPPPLINYLPMSQPVSVGSPRIPGPNITVKNIICIPNFEENPGWNSVNSPTEL